jgi:outer membrane protein
MSGARHYINLGFCAVLALFISGCVLISATDPYGDTRGVVVLGENTLAGQGGSAFKSGLDDELRLERAIEIALTNNPAIASRKYASDASKALYEKAWGALLPKVDARANLTQYRENRILNPRRPGTVDTIIFADRQLSGDLVMSMPLFAGGRYINQVRAAKLLHAASLRQLAHTRDELVFNVSSIYYSILAQERVISSLEFSQSVLTAHLRKVREMIRASKAARVDELRTEVRLADLQQKQVAEDNILSIQKRALVNLLGIDGGFETAPEIEGEFGSQFTAEIDENEAVVQALVNRDDYRAARLELEAQARRVDIARAGHLPSVMLEATAGSRWDAHDTSRDQDVASVGVGVSLPIFEGGMISAEIRRERANLSAMREKLREKELRIRLEVETSVLNITSSLERVKATEKSIEQATESLRVEQEKYRYSKGSITDVLDAQYDLLNVQVSHCRALADHSTAIVQYNLAVGEDLINGKK